MREKMFSIGDDAWIEDSNGNRAFKADGKALQGAQHVRPRGRQWQRGRLHPREDAAHQGHDGDRARRPKIATVKKALISPLRDRFDVKIEGGEDWDVQGNIVDHEYEIKSGRDKVAEVSMKWFRVRDTYGIEIEPGQDVGLVLAVAVALDEMRRGQ